MNCNKCCFFATNSFNDKMGLCKRYPEERNKSSNDWCGEFKYLNVLAEKVVNQVTEKRGKKSVNKGTE